MWFPFSEIKAAQAAAYVLSRHGGQFDYISLVKFLYVADKQALVECGVPITGDRMVSMPYGPVLSHVKNCLTGEEPGRVWRRYVTTRDDQNIVRLVKSEKTELSPYDVDVLDRVDAEHGRKTPDEWMAYGHDLKEWEDPKGSSSPILPEKILYLAGASEAHIRRAEEAAVLLTRARELAAT